MKILILQLARLGDVYMSWPVVRAMKRMHPGCEVHMLVRPRFKAACEGLESLDQIHLLPTDKFLGPVLDPGFRLDESLNSVDEFLESLALENFDQIVNLSFSEVSSYVVQFLSGQAKVAGYTRHSDGYIHLPDDVSRYFWAQVGPGYPNRIHVIDLLSGVAGADLVPDDFRLPSVNLQRTIDGDYFVLHVGASEAHKQISHTMWSDVIREYQKIKPHQKWVLIGSANESAKAEKIVASAEQTQIVNRVGHTQLSEIFAYLKHSCGLIGADSAPMHMVPFVNQKAFCVSYGGVKFWETGPITLGSVVIRIESEMEVSSSDLALLIEHWSNEKILSQDTRVYQAVEEVPRFKNSKPTSDFAWDLIRAVYMGTAFPVTSDLNFYKACVRMFEANYVAIENLKKRGSMKRELLTSILDRVDEIFLAIVGQVPTIIPFFRWYQAEKTRIQPGTFEQIAQDTLIIHEVYQNLLKKYLLEEDVRRVETHGNI